MKSRLQVGDYDFPFMDELPVSTTMRVADIREPDKRQGAFTKTIYIPGTPEVNQAFEYIFQVNSVTNNFNANYKTEAAYFVNEFRVLKGSLELICINKKLQEGVYQIIYECKISGDNSNLFSDIVGLYLTDIDFSDLDHTLTISATPTSDTKFVPANYGVAYVYPFIDYGLGDTSGPGIPTPLQNSWDFAKLKPAIFEREIVSRIFKYAGYYYDTGSSTYKNSIGATWSTDSYTWESGTYFDSTYEKRIVIPSNAAGALQIPASVKGLAAMNAGMTGDDNNSVGHVLVGSSYYYTFSPIVVPYDDVTTSPFFDPSTALSASFEWIAPANPAIAYYDISATVNYEIVINPPATTTTYLGAYSVQVNIEKSTNAGSTWSTIASNSKTVTISGSGTTPQVIPDALVVGLDGYQVNAGEYYRIKITPATALISYLNGATPIVAGASTLELNIQGGTTQASLFNVSIKRADLPYGGTVVMNDTIPKNITQLDFLTSIIRCENLHFEPDYQNPKNYKIYVRDEFYDYTSFVDWSDKLAVNEDIVIYPMGDLDYGRYRWTYKQDSDYYNKLYQDNYNEIYGQQVKDVDNDFLRDEKAIEVIFSPTPITNWNQSSVIVPRFFKKNDNTNEVSPQGVNIRRLYYGGLITNGFTAIALKRGTSTVTMFSYPYAGNVDNPYNPSVDLNFGITRTLFYRFAGLVYTTNTRYNQRYYKWFNEITDRDSKIVKAWFNLNEIDINTFSFRKPVFVHDAYYLVNSIENYNPQERTLTQVELLKLKLGSAHTPTQVGPEEYDPVGNSGDSARTSKSNLSLGTDNFNGGVGCSITGSGCSIAPGAENVNLINCTNVSVNYDVENFTGIGLSNVTIDNTYNGKILSNTIYEGQVKNRTITITANYTVNPLYNTYIIDASSADTTLTLKDIGEVITVTRLDATANAVTIEDYLSMNINGSASKSLTSQYEKITLVNTGTEWIY